jgi:hypothetical protein
MRTESTSRTLRILPWILFLLASMLLAGCSASSTMRVANGATPTTAATTAMPTVGVTPPPGGPCGSASTSTRAGDLLITNPYPGGSTYPSTKVPDGTPIKPLQVRYGSSSSGVALPGDPLTNPNLHEIVGGFGGGYRIDVCNASATQAHTIQSVTARIDSFAAYSGALNEWGACAGAYDASTKHSSGGGCGGGFYTACEYLHATFPAAAGSGTSVSAAQVGVGRNVAGDGASCPQFGALPVSLPPGGDLSILIGMSAPTASGTYAVAFGVTADAAAPAFVSAPRMLFAPAAHEWTGSACATPTMQSQIPAASSPTYYICP